MELKNVPKLPDSDAPYSDWHPKTLAAYQETILEITRVQRINANFMIVSIAFMREAMEKKLINPEDLAQWIQPAQEHGLALLGIDVDIESAPDPNAELSAEERYEREGLQVWDGKSKSP